MTRAKRGSMQQRLCSRKTILSAAVGGKRRVSVASDVIGGTKYDIWKPAGIAIDYLRYISIRRDLAEMKGP